MYTENWAAFVAFAREQLDSGDIDPMYPLLCDLYERPDLDAEQRYWFTFLYAAYYHVGSAAVAFDATHRRPKGLAPNLLRLPTGVERRGHRDRTKLLRHVADYLGKIDAYGSQKAYWERGQFGNDVRKFVSAYYQAVSLYGNGRWAAYKMCDLLLNVHGFGLRFPAGLLGQSSGPQKGLELLGLPGDTDEQEQRLRFLLTKALGRDVRYDQLETLLCDFHSMAAGRYYPGHDIDEMLERINAASEEGRLYPVLRPSMKIALMESRRAVFGPSYLAELGDGPYGVDKARCRHYRNTGVVPCRISSSSAQGSPAPASSVQLPPGILMPS